MPNVIWTDEAEAQLAEVRSDETAERLVALAAGLGKFPERGRRIPELTGSAEYDILREVVLPHEARVIYLFVPDSNEVIILGLMTKGRRFERKVLGPYFHRER